MPAKKVKTQTRKKKAPAKKRPAGPKKSKDIFSVKKHISQGHILIAACDLELLGKTLEDGDLCIEVREGFYGGEKVDEAILYRLLEMSTMANLVGKKAVGIAIKMGLVDEECVITVKGIPHAQALKFC
jgi:hypothetical protein